MSLETEMPAARRTLELSASTSRSFVRSLGELAPILVLPFPQAHLGRRPGFVQTVIDDKYWFAKLYELITYYEILDRDRFQHPAFVMHFIPIFYNLYFDALQAFQAGDTARVSALWLRHFRCQSGNGGTQRTLDGVNFSIVSGVTAHVQGDMATALEQAYRTWDESPKPPFAALHDDFFDRNRPIFERVRASFFIDMNDKAGFPFRPEVGQLVIVTGEMVSGAGLSVNQIYQWRTTAWNEAARRLSAPAAATPTATPPPRAASSGGER